MTEKQIRVSGAWIGRRVEVEFMEYGPSPNGRTIYVSLTRQVAERARRGDHIRRGFRFGFFERAGGTSQVLPAAFHVGCEACGGAGGGLGFREEAYRPAALW